ncbi:HDOD domain-containing protein [Chitinibacter bivalviorum]|uniref:HDOD domain-containing protein n=1 Tax=Chitinibacter bivalviorum TaxID=2739434 RepID=A0A7H9BJ91_9NEIS|nr:HDOD domain-containing protein [Chitinibacter bivalviorum]QLG88442.1 HDOD domain-containing protein [Chitinibacter bivalviorum]
MKLLQLSPLWNCHRQWCGILLNGSDQSLALLNTKLSNPTHAQTMLFFVREEQHRPEYVCEALDLARLHCDVGDVEQILALDPNALAIGNWYTAPSSQQSAPPKSELLELIAQVAADADVQVIEQIFARAPDLTFRLLKLVNSVGLGSRVEISSIRHAITILGRNQLQRWVQLLIYAEQFGKSGGIDPLLLAALLRAKRLEAWAKNGWINASPDSAFLTGMLSLLDRLFHQPLADLLQRLSLNEKLASALLYRVGDLGLALNQLEIMEASDQPQLWPISPSHADLTWIESELAVFEWAGSLAASLSK